VIFGGRSAPPSDRHYILSSCWNIFKNLKKNALLLAETVTFSFLVGEAKDKISILAFITLQSLNLMIYSSPSYCYGD
jgi:hypothetical protein